MSYKAQMNGGGESYSGVVLRKQPNKGRGGPQEAVEGRPLTKENMEEPNSYRTQSRASEPNGLDRVRQSSKRLAAIIQGRNRVREQRQHGSVRGAVGNCCPYRDPRRHSWRRLVSTECARTARPSL